MAEYRLEMLGISKSFPGVKALDNVSLKVRPGTVHALMTLSTKVWPWCTRSCSLSPSGASGKIFSAEDIR